jgi:hypothetical protein
MTDNFQEPTSGVSQPKLLSDSSPVKHRPISPAAVSADTAGEEPTAAVTSDKEQSSGSTEQVHAPNDSSSEIPLEVVCDFDDPTRLKLMKWNNGKAEIEAYFDDNGRRIHPGKVYSAIRKAVVLPNYPIPSRSTRTLFETVKSMFEQQAELRDPTSSLLTYWAFMSWFADVLPLAPTLVITGNEYQGDLLLRALSCVCRYPLMLAGINQGMLRMLPTDILVPTLLIYETRLTAGALSLLHSSNAPGYFVPVRGSVQDLYCPKAIYVGEQVGHGLGGISIPVNLSPSGTGVVKRLLPRKIVSDYQNRLLAYRVNNYHSIRDSEFSLSTSFVPSTAAMAHILAAVIVGDDELKGGVISVLAAVDERLREARQTSLESIILEAVLSFCHEPNTQEVLVHEIAKRVNGIYENLGERLQVSEEKVGHALKRLGLFTRRVGNKGRGLELTKEMQLLVHELSRLQHGQAVFPDHPGCAYCQTSVPTTN